MNFDSNYKQQRKIIYAQLFLYSFFLTFLCNFAGLFFFIYVVLLFVKFSSSFLMHFIFCG